MEVPSGVYRQRNPKSTPWYRCVEDHFDEFTRGYDERFGHKYGFWRPHIEKIIFEFLDCGDLKQGFARVRCGECDKEFLVAFSCKRRHFCPSCHAKRVVEFGEFLRASVLEQVPHRHVVFSLPKFLRRYFLYNRKLLGGLSRCAWKCLKLFLAAACPGETIPGAVVSIQTFGDLLTFHPHLHILVTDGAFQSDREFIRAPLFDPDRLEELFRQKVFYLLLTEGRLTRELVEMHSTWRHSGFHVFCGEAIAPEDETARENIARYIVRASMSQERLTYLENEGKVVYQTKEGTVKKEFPAIEWMAATCSHIPNPGEHMVRYYGFYSNAARGKRGKKEDGNLLIVRKPLFKKRDFRLNWARLIKKIYEADPMRCPKCGGAMRIIAFIEQAPVIEKILRHLGLWETPSRAPPRKEVTREDTDEDEFIQHDQPFPEFYPDPEYSWTDYS